MKTFVNRKKGNDVLIVVFSSWVVDEQAFLPYFDGSFDLMVLSGYSSDDPFLIPSSKIYRRVIVIAWSSGVWATEYFLSKTGINPDTLIAVNGTPFLVNDFYGIPVPKCEDFINDLNFTKIADMYNNIFGNEEILGKSADKTCRKDIEILHKDLRWLYNRAMEKSSSCLIWNYVVISQDNDLMPISGIRKCWDRIGSTKKIFIDMPFYPFKKWNTLLDFVEYVEQANTDK